MLQFLAQLPDWLQSIVVFLGALSTLATAAHGLLALVAAKWPAATPAADFAGTWGVHLKDASNYVASFLLKVTGSDGKRGFSSLRCMAFVVVLGAISLAACGLFSRTAGPAANLGVCLAPDVENAVTSNDAATSPLSLADLVAELVLKCGVDAIALVDAIVGSEDPIVRSTNLYREAESLWRDPAKSEQLRAKVSAKVSARRAGAR